MKERKYTYRKPQSVYKQNLTHINYTCQIVYGDRLQYIVHNRQCIPVATACGKLISPMQCTNTRLACSGNNMLVGGQAISQKQFLRLRDCFNTASDIDDINDALKIQTMMTELPDFPNGHFASNLTPVGFGTTKNSLLNNTIGNDELLDIINYTKVVLGTPVRPVFYVQDENSKLILTDPTSNGAEVKVRRIEMPTFLVQSAETYGFDVDRLYKLLRQKINNRVLYVGVDSFDLTASNRTWNIKRKMQLTDIIKNPETWHLRLSTATSIKSMDSEAIMLCKKLLS